MSEREITTPVDLCLPDGRLNPAAVGWTRQPLHRSNLRGWGRTKRWEYWGIVTPSHVIGVVVSSLDYAGVNSLYVLDRESGREWSEEAVTPFARGVVMPDVSGSGHAGANAGGVRVAIEQSGEVVRLVAHAGALEVDLEILPGGESLGVVVPWSDRRFQYTVKDVARPVRGHLVLDGTTHQVGQDAFAVLDHGRGRWPYAMTWNWAAASTPDRSVGVQLSGRWTDGTGSTENALVLGGRLHKISSELTWTYDRRDWLAPWSITGERVEVLFRPFHERVARTNLLVVSGETHQCFGHVEGWLVDDAGTRVCVDGAVGWAEEARNRW